MCGSCVTSAEALILSTAGATTAGIGMVRRAADRLAGRSRRPGRLAAYEANAGFLRSLGHDPAAVLGPAPDPGPVRSTAPVAAPAGALLGA